MAACDFLSLVDALLQSLQVFQLLTNSKSMQSSLSYPAFQWQVTAADWCEVHAVQPFSHPAFQLQVAGC